MKKSSSSLYFFITLITVILSLSGVVSAQEVSSLKVADAAICRDVVDRQAADLGTHFEASVGKLFCFSRITGASDPIEITHVWYFGDTERAQIILSVKSTNWRTYSSKKIQPYEIGDWHVEVIGPDGSVLQTVEFKITP